MSFFNDSRYIGLYDVPEPGSIDVKFVYNFFVPDERTNVTGQPQIREMSWELQKEINPRLVESSLPRYVEINFSPVRSGDDVFPWLSAVDLSRLRNRINTEERIMTPKDASVKYSDASLSKRVSGKANLLAGLLGNSTNDALSKAQVIQEFDDKIDVSITQELLSIEDKAGISAINEVTDVSDVPIFSSAEDINLIYTLDRRLLKSSLMGSYNFESYVKTKSQIQASQDAQSYLPHASADSGPMSDEPMLEIIGHNAVQNASSDVRTQTAGYIVERIEEKTGNVDRYYINDPTASSYIDTKVKYGIDYRYSLRTVAAVEMVAPQVSQNANQNANFERIRLLVASKPSITKTVRTIEKVPPTPPDGVFYRFNYDSGQGLFIRWQMPVGKQRDTKYFQVFRRKTIYDPYECIAQLDFDDSDEKSPKFEIVNPDRVTKLKGPQTMFLDPEFSRDSSYMYAICAIDAHGLTSNYSAQTHVTFNKTTNEISLKSVSRSNAPKQYPNFYIDPSLDTNVFVDSLTEDSMKVSKKFKIDIYFDPDTVEFTSKNGTRLPLLATDNSQGVYKMHLLNIDRQKSQILELRIDDLR